MDIYKIIDFFRKTPRKCKKCKREYDANDLSIIVGQLQWREKQEKKEGSTGGAFSVTGTNYVQFIRYKVYHRIVAFRFKCPDCGEIKVWTKMYELYDGRSGRSQSTQQEIALLKYKIEKTLGKRFLNGKQPQLSFTDEF